MGSDDALEQYLDPDRAAYSSLQTYLIVIFLCAVVVLALVIAFEPSLGCKWFNWSANGCAANLAAWAPTSVVEYRIVHVPHCAIEGPTDSPAACLSLKKNARSNNVVGALTSCARSNVDAALVMFKAAVPSKGSLTYWHISKGTKVLYWNNTTGAWDYDDDVESAKGFFGVEPIAPDQYRLSWVASTDFPNPLYVTYESIGQFVAPLSATPPTLGRGVWAFRSELDPTPCAKL